MSGRFENMRKVAQEPAAKMLALANIRLATRLDASASASAQAVLDELDRKNATIDQLKLMAVILPPRERVWWACLAARDCLGDVIETPSLTVAESWVFQPSPELVEAARHAVDHADVQDDTVNCAIAVIFADGRLGPGDLAEFPAPAGAAEGAAFAMNVIALGTCPDDLERYAGRLVDRAVDIARGGNGKLDPVKPPTDKGKF